VNSIHRLFDERKLLEEVRAASSEGRAEQFEADQKLEEQGSAFPLYQVKQVIM
jgi:hypothetical protein